MNLDAAQLRTILPADLEKVHLEHGSGLTESLLAQSRVFTRQLHEAPLVFQPRLLDEASYLKTSHVRTLASADKQSGRKRLEKILVFPVAGLRVVIDGHSRRRAYLHNDPNGNREIPIKYFKGTFREAMHEAARSNSQDKLPLSTREKAEMAWRLVKLEEGRADASTVRQIAASAGCGKSVVGEMRKLLASHPVTATAENPRELSWRDARRGDRESIEYDDAWEEMEISKWAIAAAKAFGPIGNSQPVAVLAGIERAYPNIRKVIEDRIEAEREREDDLKGTADF